MTVKTYSVKNVLIPVLSGWFFRQGISRFLGDLPEVLIPVLSGWFFRREICDGCGVRPRRDSRRVRGGGSGGLWSWRARGAAPGRRVPWGGGGRDRRWTWVLR